MLTFFGLIWNFAWGCFTDGCAAPSALEILVDAEGFFGMEIFEGGAYGCGGQRVDGTSTAAERGEIITATVKRGGKRGRSIRIDWHWMRKDDQWQDS